MFTHADRLATEKADFRPALLRVPYAGFLPEKRMAKMTYIEQLRHPNWQKKRLETLEDASWECENCGDKEMTLNVHHKRYIKGRMAWEYERELLEVLCEPCHKAGHEDREILDRMLAEIGTGGLPRIVGLVAGYLDGSCDLDSGLAFMAFEGRELFFEIGLAAAALEAGNVDGWRDLVRARVTSGKASPAMTHAAADWDEFDK